MRVDNEKTAISRGAGAWGEINPSYRRFAQTLRFHVDACPPRTPEAKGKVERGIRTSRGVDPRRQHWHSLSELQHETDRQDEQRATRRLCPATGKSVRDTWIEECRLLTPLPEILPEPFDVVVLQPEDAVSPRSTQQRLLARCPRRAIALASGHSVERLRDTMSVDPVTFDRFIPKPFKNGFIRIVLDAASVLRRRRGLRHRGAQ